MSALPFPSRPVDLPGPVDLPSPPDLPVRAVGRAAPATTRRPRLYAAHPMTCYRSEHERACLDALAGHFPGAEIVNPATRGWTNDTWRRAWPRLVMTLSTLVIFPDEDGTVGTGCLREVADAIAAGVPVAVLDPCFGLCELGGFDLLPPDMRTRAATAWPVAGDRIDPAALCRPVVEAS